MHIYRILGSYQTEDSENILIPKFKIIASIVLLFCSKTNKNITDRIDPDLEIFRLISQYLSKLEVIFSRMNSDKIEKLHVEILKEKAL